MEKCGFLKGYVITLEEKEKSKSFILCILSKHIKML